MRRARRRRRLGLTLGLAAGVVLLAHPVAGAASDVWGNVGPASPLGSGGLFGRYPLSHYMLDQHFDAVSASFTGGVDASGVAPMIAYFLASVLWALTSFLAEALISLFAFAFSLDLLNGSTATGGAGALAPVARAIHSIYAGVFGAPWLVLAVSVLGIWAMWKALVQRRYAETAGAIGLSLIYVVLALFFVFQPAQTIGAASSWANRMSVAFLAISTHGSASGGASARDEGAQQLFDLLVFKPWVVLEFGGLEHCALQSGDSQDGDPESVAVRPLSPDPSRDASLAASLRRGTEVTAEGKVCINNANKYSSHFLRFGLGSDERDAEYEALDDGDSSKLPDGDPGGGGYRLGAADRPATDAMEEGGQYQRLIVALVVFAGELGAFLLLGSLSVGVILAQILLLLLLAFAPVALVAAAIPGRGHAFFRGWLEKLAGYLLRKAAYSLVLAVLLAVNGALASATAELGWLMSFGLQAIFFWAVFLQRKALTESLVGIATRPGAPGREGSLRVLGLYYGARTAARPFRARGRGPGSSRGAPRRMSGGRQQGAPAGESPSAREGAGQGAPVVGVSPAGSAGRQRKPTRAEGAAGEAGESAGSPGPKAAGAEKPAAKRAKRRAPSAPNSERSAQPRVVESTGRDQAKGQAPGERESASQAPEAGARGQAAQPQRKRARKPSGGEAQGSPPVSKPRRRRGRKGADR